MNALRRQLLRLRNFTQYARELGLRGAVQISRTAMDAKSHTTIDVRGIRTPVHVRVGDSDFAALRQVLGRGECAVKLPQMPRVIIDAGANVGYSSLYFANRYPKATIIAVEPDDDNCQMFRDNLATYANVTLIQGGVWPKRGWLRIENPTASAWGFIVRETDEPDDSCMQAHTMDDLIGEHPFIDLLKLDIEGSEKQLFESNDLTWLDRVGTMMVEVHDRFRPGCSNAVKKALADRPHQMHKNGEYLVYHFEHHHMARSMLPSSQRVT